MSKKLFYYGASLTTFFNKDSLSFDGFNERLHIADTGDFNLSAGTITAWVKRFSSAAYFFNLGQLASGTNIPYLIQIRNTNKLGFQNFNKVTSEFGYGNTVMATDTWYHIAFSGNGSVYKMWVDGVPQIITVEGGSAAHTGRFFAPIYTAYSDRIFSLSAIVRQAGDIFSQIKIDLFTIYNKQLSDAEVLQDMNTDNKLAVSMAGNLVAFLPLGEAPGDSSAVGGTLFDLVGSNNGTPLNMEAGDLQNDIHA